MVGLELRPPIHEHIVRRHRLLALMARRDQDQLLVEEMLDDQAGAIRRPVHDCEVESAFDQPIHQSDRGSGRRRHRNVGDIFAHPGEPLEEKSVPQTRLSAH